MLHKIAEPDKSYDKYNLLNPFKSNRTSHFYQIDQSISFPGLLGVVFLCPDHL